MLLLIITLLLTEVNAEPALNPEGSIAGAVLNGSQNREPLGDVEVQLRAQLDGIFEPIASTKTDSMGRFVFHGVPLDPTIVYLPGANRGEIHYPGQRVQLDSDHRAVSTNIVVFDAVHTPSPLTASRHEIDIQTDERLMTVTETLVVSNPSLSTYIGQSQGERGTVTLRLTIPENFDKVTFNREFYGRRFRIIDHRLVTDIPWPPGDRELKLTYHIPSEGGAGQFRRLLDLPTSDLRVHVQTIKDGGVTCELPRLNSSGDGFIFASVGKQLPAGHIIDIQIGPTPFAWMQYVRWGSLLLLGAAIVVTFAIHRRRARQAMDSTEIPCRGGKRSIRSPGRTRHVA